MTFQACFPALPPYQSVNQIIKNYKHSLFVPLSVMCYEVLSDNKLPGQNMKSQNLEISKTCSASLFSGNNLMSTLL